MGYLLFDKKSGVSVIESLSNQQLIDELHRPIIRKFKRRIYSSFKDNIWGADLAETHLLSKYNKGIKFLLCVIYIFSKYARAVPLKEKTGIIIVIAFQSTLDNLKRKPNKIWVDQGSKFYNNSFKKWLDDNEIKICSAYNEGRSIVAERFIRTLKNKIYKYMTAVSKNIYFDELNNIFDKYNNTYHFNTTIKMKPVDVKFDSYVEYNVDSNDKDPKFKISDQLSISKYKNIFAKGYVPIWSEEVFVINKIKKTVQRTYVIMDLNGEEIVGAFYEKELQKTNQEEFRIEKVIKRKGNKLYVNWKGCDTSFNSWIDKKDIV